MAVQIVDLDEFMELSAKCPILDVRSEGEFEHAHIPGAVSFPLFNNEERKVVGTAYKQQSREKAIKIGLEYFGKKMVAMVEQAESICQNDKRRKDNLKDERPTVLVHCWRGGMRSAGVGWLLDLYGFNVYTLRGGYKAFRRHCLEELEKQFPLRILGGYTGSGKTHVLHELKKKGEIIIDLEDIANHKGSAFGYRGSQPSQEMFENKLALAMQKASQAAEATGKTIWIEDESQRIGSVNVPINFWNHMRTCPLVFLDIPFEARLQQIVKDYGAIDKEKLVGSIMRIQKRLGGLETKTAVSHLLENDLAECFRVLLKYYDKQYEKALQKRESDFNLLRKENFDTVDAFQIAAVISSQTKETI